MCATDMRGKHGNHSRGPGHYRWNSGKIISSHGYVKVRVGVGHPLADPNGYAYEHLVVWVSAGKPLPGPGELIHHRDEDKTHNSIDNLELKPRPKHVAEHNSKRYGRPVITAEDVIAIRDRRANGEELKSIAKDYGIAFQTVSKIARGKTHARVK